jgi:hypothetical protein
MEYTEKIPDSKFEYARSIIEKVMSSWSCDALSSKHTAHFLMKQMLKRIKKDEESTQ